MTPITIPTAVSLTGRAWKTIQKVIREQQIPSIGVDKKSALYDSERLLGAIYLGAGDSDALDLTAEKARHSKAQADRIELDLRVRRGELLEVDDVLDEWAAKILACKTALLSIPSRAAPMIGGPSGAAHVETVLKRYIREALEELASDGKPSRSTKTTKPGKRVLDTAAAVDG